MKAFPSSKQKKDLAGLPMPKQVAFLLLLCGRMLPGLEKFAADTGFNLLPYREGLALASAFLEGQHNVESYEEASQECRNNAPDTEQFTHVLTSAALNAALNISLLLNYLAKHDVNDIFEAATFARDTVAMYVQHVEAPQPLSLDLTVVLNHSLVRREQKQQEEDVAFLSNLPATGKIAQQVQQRLGQTRSLIPLEAP